ncbi:hypothetical protein [Pseudonocardia sp. WMMC193]|uniref:hypothetical protein n=1 Tax=Pseudonocardia sp. WMMC193 TaxID=2911965 RepID=UPI001F37017B|nr:hypothetical protein [Pseudonocardia sp. WMMC193]MCF7551008.1 hypothetical protein [Pseudonocardia sp. WMMC193]
MPDAAQPTDQPAEIDPADGPPTTWVDHVVALAAEHEHLPSLLTDPVDALSVDGHWQLYPWALRLDVASMLAWAAQFDGGLTAAAVTLRSIPGGAAVTVSGRYADTPTDLIGMTHRHDGGPGPRTVDALRELAHHELAALGRTLDDLRLDLAQATDPLNTLGSVTA